MMMMTVRLLIIFFGFISVVHNIGIGGRFYYLPGIVAIEAFSFPLATDHNTHNALYDDGRNSDIITNRIEAAATTAAAAAATTAAAAAAATFDYSRNIPPPIDDTTPCEVITDKDFYFPSKEEFSLLPKGDQGGYHIVRQYIVPPSLAFMKNSSKNITTTTTLQYALTVLDPVNYPTLSKARKACRKGMILVQVDDRKRRMDHAGDDNDNNDNGNDFQEQPQEQQPQQQQQRGKVGDIVFPGDIIGCQMFLGNCNKKQCYPNITYEKPQFNVPILYEDDHIAVLNKPAGIAVYSDTRNSSGGKKQRRTIHFLLPFILTPPKQGTDGGILRRPGIVHRIDKPTSGILVVAKTKISMQSLHEQFRTRKVQKIYTAIINGDIQQQVLQQQQRNQQYSNGDDVDDDEEEDLSCWNVIDYPLGGKYAITSWKLLRKVFSLNAKDGILSKVEIRLETGRYHQIRRHFSWLYRRPLVGDHLYAGFLQAHHFRSKGLYLCSNGISFHHPIMKNDNDDDQEEAIVEVTIDLPKRFDKLLNAEESWALYDHSC
jgi:23S rRNA-/tRNA-specific pseudouridylate synthase